MSSHRSWNSIGGNSLASRTAHPSRRPTQTDFLRMQACQRHRSRNGERRRPRPPGRDGMDCSSHAPPLPIAAFRVLLAIGFNFLCGIRTVSILLCRVNQTKAISVRTAHLRLLLRNRPLTRVQRPARRTRRRPARTDISRQRTAVFREMTVLRLQFASPAGA